MSRGRWECVETGDNITLTPKPNATPSAPIHCVFKGIKTTAAGVLACVMVLNNSKLECYSMSYYEIRKDNG